MKNMSANVQVVHHGTVKLTLNSFISISSIINDTYVVHESNYDKNRREINL